MDENTNYALHHWMDLMAECAAILDDMVEINGSDVMLHDDIDAGVATFHVGTFKISRHPVTVSSWNKVLGFDLPTDWQTYVNGVSFRETLDYRRRLNVTMRGPGVLRVPTEAQLELARQSGRIQFSENCDEMCMTRFCKLDRMEGHHFLDNIPKAVPTEGNPLVLVVRGCTGGRSSVIFSQLDEHPSPRLGFRLVLVDYQTEKDPFLDCGINGRERISPTESIQKGKGAS